jgi:hypothetical protein
MQETGTGNVEAPPPARRALSPLVAVSTVVAFAVVSWLSLSLFSQDEASVEAPTPMASSDRREQDVVQQFKALIAAHDDAFDTRKTAALNAVYAVGSPAGERARAGMRDLLKQKVVDRGRYRTVSTKLQSLSGTDATVQYVAIYYPCFRTEAGKDITRSPGVVRQQKVYELRLEGGEWRIWDVALQQDEVIIKEESSCERV